MGADTRSNEISRRYAESVAKKSVRLIFFGLLAPPVITGTNGKDVGLLTSGLCEK